MAGASAPQFRPLTEADVQDLFTQVTAATAALDERFVAAGNSADSWKEYLGWDKFKSELQNAKPDRTVLNGVHEKLAAGNEGLELKWFANLRVALGKYLQVAGSVGNPDLEAAFKSQIDELTRQVKSLSAHPTTEETKKIADHLTWLETARQAPELVHEVRGRFAAANFHVQIGSEVVSLGVGGPVDEVAPIDDCILGTTIHGMGHTVGQTTSALVPNATFANFDVMLQAVNYSNNVGRNGPVCIYSTGRTCLAATKRFWLDEAGLHAMPAEAVAAAHTTITNIVSIKDRKIVEKIAWRRAGEQLCQAEAIASEHARGRLAARVDEQAEPMLQDANRQLAVKLKKPLDERRAFSHALSFDALATALEMHGTQGLPSQLAAPSAPPELAHPADIVVRVHESAINNSVETVLSGMQLTDDMVQRASLDLFGKLPEQLKPDQNQEPFTIVFPAENTFQPITVSFGDGGFTITVRGQKFFLNDQPQPGKMNISAKYKFEKRADGFWAIREGDLQIYPFGKRPDEQLSARLFGIKKVLQRKFGKIFEQQVKLQGFKFTSGKLASAGQFMPQEIIAQDGWLAVGYCRVKSEGAPTTAN